MTEQKYKFYYEFEEHTDERGTLVSLEANRNLPIDVKRVFYIYDVPEKTVRGQHSHKDCEQVIVAIHGSFWVELLLSDFNMSLTRLDNPSVGVYVQKGVEVTLTNFTEDAVCMVLADKYYDEEDCYDSDSVAVVAFPISAPSSSIPESYTERRDEISEVLGG